MSLPIVISSGQVKEFNFYERGAIRRAMVFQERLYRQVQVFGRDDRDQAYALGSNLAEGGYPITITVNSSHYAVWADLRCQEPVESVVSGLDGA